MGRMNKRRKELSEEEIDQFVTTQADDESAWEKPVSVRPYESSNLNLTSPKDESLGPINY